MNQSSTEQHQFGPDNTDKSSLKSEISVSCSSSSQFAAHTHVRFMTISTSIQKTASLICKQVWSPIIWRDGRRTSQNYIRANWLAFDFDDPRTNINECWEKFRGYRSFIATTKSHNKPKNGVICERFRLMLKLEKPITDRTHYTQVMKRMTKELNADKACVDAGRFFFPSIKIIKINPHGSEYVPKSPLQTILPKQKNFKSKIHYRVPVKIAKSITNGFNPGERNNMIFKTAFILARLGFSRQFITTELEPAVMIDQSFTREEFVRTINRGFQYGNRS